MDFFEAQDFAKKMYEGKNVSFRFDTDCMREMSFVLTNGQCNENCHVAYNKVKIIVDSEEKHVMPIKPHRMCFKADDMRAEITKLQVRKEDVDGQNP